MSLAEFITLGERLGLQGAELRNWADEQVTKAREEDAKAREERAAEREATKQRLELEEKNLQLRLRLAEVGESSGSGNGASHTNQAEVLAPINPHNLIPMFNDSRDDLDAYLKRFEHVATGQGWPKEKWATALSLCLGGEALKVFGRLSPEDSLDYNKAKLALLKRFRFTAEGYRERFRQSKPQDGETGKQYATRLFSYFDRWVEMANQGKTFNAVRDLIVAEQFLNNCHSRLALFLRERNCKTVDEASEAADHYLEAQRQHNLLVFKERLEQNPGKETNEKPGVKSQVRCFICDKIGHKTSDCRVKTKQPYCEYCRRYGHDVQSCRRNEPGAKGSSACCILPPGQQKDAREGFECGTKQQDETLSNALGVWPRKPFDMLVLKGELFGQTVWVLRDTGSNSIVVRRDLVPDAAMIGTESMILLADGSSINVPEAEVNISSPYFSGVTVAKCMERPLYDVIIGNVPGADPNWSKWNQIPIGKHPRLLL